MGRFKYISQAVNSRVRFILDKNSQIKFSDSETQQLFKKLNHAKLQQQYLQARQAPTKANLEVYLQDISDNLASDDDLKEYELSRVLDTYLKYILSYIFDFFNTSGKTEEEKHLIDLDKILKKHLNKIITFYIDSLEDKLSKINLN